MNLFDLFNPLSTIVTVTNVVNEILKRVSEELSKINWEELGKSVGNVAQAAFNLSHQIDPNRNIVQFLEHQDLTRHSFNELNKFSGGLIKNTVNTGTLINRAGRGDAISKQELVTDAITLIQIAVLASGGGPAIGGFIGSRTGKELCKGQGDHKGICEAAFTILGIAAGSYTQATYFPTPAEQAAQAAQDQAVIVGSEGASEAATKTLNDFILEAGIKYGEEKVISMASREVIKACQNSNIIGDRECAILGQVGANYASQVAQGKDVKWIEFLAEQAATVSAALMLERLFPPDSPEGVALRNKRRQLEEMVIVNRVTTTKTPWGAYAAVGAGALLLASIL